MNVTTPNQASQLIEREIQDAQLLIDMANALAKDFPDDEHLPFSARQYQHRMERLRVELAEALANEQAMQSRLNE